MATTYSFCLLMHYLETLLRKIKKLNLIIKLQKSAADKKVLSFKFGFNWLAFQNVKNNNF